MLTGFTGYSKCLCDNLFLLLRIAERTITCRDFVCVGFDLNARLRISNSNSKFYLIVDLSSALLRCVLYCVIASYVQRGSLVSAICGLQFTEALGHPLRKRVLIACEDFNFVSLLGDKCK